MPARICCLRARRQELAGQGRGNFALPCQGSALSHPKTPAQYAVLMSDHHAHDHKEAIPGKERRLTIVAALTGSFMLVEAVGGVLSVLVSPRGDAGNSLYDFTSHSIE